jgi:hypothetical protein
MADFFIVVEIIKLNTFTTGGFYAAPFVVGYKVKTGDLSGVYFFNIYGATDNTNKQTLNIKSVYINISEKQDITFTLNDCKAQEKSFYFDATNQILYIHYNHLYNPNALNVEIGVVSGYTNDNVRTFNDIQYRPEVISIPNYQKEADPLQYVRQAFFGGNIRFRNDGRFDGQGKYNGNDILVFVGEEGDTYADLKPLFANYIEDYNTTLNDADFSTVDVRERDSIKIPNKFFNTTDFPDITEDLIGKIVPEAYGPLKGIPGISINGGTKFRFASKITGTPIVKAKKNNKWVTVTPLSIDNDSGTVTLSVADAYVDGSAANGFNDIKADGIFVNIANPGSIIEDLNNEYLDIPFTASNYNTTEWNNEKQYLADVGLYLDEQLDIYTWIEKLQSGSQVGFRYDIENGIRTLRLDNPNRNPVLTIFDVEILNNEELPVDNNLSLYATTAQIEYARDYTEDITLKVENVEFKETVYKDHRAYKEFISPSLLQTLANAQAKASIIMEDQKEIRPVFNVLVKNKKYFDLRIYDIINAYIRYPGQLISTKEVDTLFIKKNATDTYNIKKSGLLTYNIIKSSHVEERAGYREYYGLQRCQVIGIAPDLETGAIMLRLRQRDYSTKFQELTGYIP